MRNVTESFVQGTMTSSDVGGAAQRQYYARPADQKFDSLDALYGKVHSRRMASIEIDTQIIDMSAHVQPGGGLVFRAKDNFMTPSHWAFGQVCSLTGVPAAYMRKLATQGGEDLVAKNLNHSIGKAERNGYKLLAVDEPNGDDTTMYAATSPTYGRIWDADVVDAAKTVIDAQNGKFFSPWGWGKKFRALFASSQDVFMYFIDGGSIVDGGMDTKGQPEGLHRGIYIWNSEVGAATFGIATFLFRETCGNFLVWGAQNVKILNIRHTSGGPQKFVNDAIPALREFAATSVHELEQGVKAAKAFLLPKDDDDLITFAMQGKTFNRAEAKRAIAAARTEEGQCVTGWDLVNGYTASARMMAFADAKADLEVRAGKLMQRFATA